MHSPYWIFLSFIDGRACSLRVSHFCFGGFLSLATFGDCFILLWPQISFPCLFILFYSLPISWSLWRAKWLFISMEINDLFTHGNISHPASSFKNSLLLSRCQNQGCTLIRASRDHYQDCSFVAILSFHWSMILCSLWLRPNGCLAALCCISGFIDRSIECTEMNEFHSVVVETGESSAKPALW